MWKFDVDTSVSPANDFFQYVNNKWLADNALPDDFNRYGSFEVLNEDNRKKIREILEGEGSSPDIKLFKEGMDVEKVESQKFGPIQADLDAISQATEKSVLWKIGVVDAIEHQLPTLFGYYVSGDKKDSKNNIVYVYESGLGLPDRDYYLEENKAEELAAYRLCIMTLLKLANIGGDELDNVLALEKKIAEVTLTKVEKRDPIKTYNVHTVESLGGIAKHLDVEAVFASMKKGKLSVSNPNFMIQLSNFWEATPIETLKLYFQSKLLLAAAPYLHNEAYMIYFDCFGKALSGTKEPKPRWKRVVGAVGGELAELLGKSYSEKYFPAASKKKAIGMVEALRVSLGKRIDEAKWMGDDTKTKAHEKLAAFRVKIGYPDEWRDFSKLDMQSADSYFGKVKLVSNFNHKFDQSEAYKPVDDNKWLMGSHEVNAYYHPINNEIVFPAGILQPPFFSYDQSDAENFGGIGAVIGHEMTHGFDDQGRKFDATGNMIDWWTKEDAENYSVRTDLIKNQFAAYKVHGESVNGELTLGENIADIGGLKIAFLAYQDSTEGDIFEKNCTDGFSGAQELFLSWARVWVAHTREQEAKKRLTTDPHSPNHLRVNGVVINIPQFYKAFGLTQSDDQVIAEVW